MISSIYIDESNKATTINIKIMQTHEALNYKIAWKEKIAGD